MTTDNKINSENTSLPNVLTQPPSLPPSSPPVKSARPKNKNGFFSFAGGSIFYCLSALSIIYGIAKIMGPGFAQTNNLQDAYPCLTALNIYEIALLGVLAFIVIWKKVTDDAISLVVLVALFLVGSGLAFSTVANSGAYISSLLIGICCFALGIGKIYVLKRYIGIIFGWLTFIALTIIIAWNFGASLVLTKLSLVSDIGREHWFLSWLVLIVGGIIVFIDNILASNKIDISKNKIPFLRTTATPLMFVLILLVAVSIHQYVLGYIFDIKSEIADYLPIISIFSLIALQLSLSVDSRISSFNIALAGLPLAACGYVLLSEAALATPTYSIDIIKYIPIILGVTGVAIFTVWIKTRDIKLLAVFTAYILAIILTIGLSPHTPMDLNWRTTGAIFAVVTMGIGLFKRNFSLCFLALIIMAIGAAVLNPDGILNISPPGIFLGVAGLGTVMLALFFGRKMSEVILVFASLAIVIFSFDIMENKLALSDLVIGVGILAICGAIWFRCHQWSPLIFLPLPIIYKLWLVFTKMTAWRYIILSFILLFAGAWFSSKKSNHSQQADLEDKKLE